VAERARTVRVASGGRLWLQVEGNFKKLLGAHSPEALDAEAATVLGLWPDGRIALLNSAWQTFALANAGADVIRRWPLGANIHTGTSDVLRSYYAQASRACSSGGSRGRKPTIAIPPS
jgi:hypothetical protein